MDSENAQRVSVAENIKASLEDIGFRIDISKVSNARYKKYLENKNYDMILTGVYSGYSPDLSNYFGPNNLSNFANEEVTRLLNEIKEIKDDDELLKQKYDEIIKIFNDEMPYVFLYYNTNTLVYNPKLVGEITPNSYNIFNNIGTCYVQE